MICCEEWDTDKILILFNRHYSRTYNSFIEIANVKKGNRKYSDNE